MDRYNQWTTNPYFDAETRAELLALAETPAEIEDRFYKELEFGTGGLRGLLGAGTNRMNRYTVRQATRGLADYILATGGDSAQRGVVIAHDSRQFSTEFALEAALVLAGAGVRAYLWDSLRPTPMLSFAVRELQAVAGIVITASHNPPAYNGLKLYWEDGGQVPPERAAQILTHMRALTDLTQVVPADEAIAKQAELLKQVPASVDRTYYDRLKALVPAKDVDRTACRILYTPLHGSGNVPVRTVLTELGFPVSVVPQQEQPDPEFRTVRSPNPEEADVYELALLQAEQERPDIIMATDPDADRLGVLARDAGGQYRLLNGNQIGSLLVDFLLTQHRTLGTLPSNGAVIKTIATSNMVAGICRAHGVTLMDTHTGFKFIGDRIRSFEETGSHTFIFGFEESYGYLAGTFVRDKDAVMAALLVAEAAAYHKSQGRTLYEALEAIWTACGHFREGLHSVNLSGIEGPARMTELMADLRRQPPTSFGPIPVAFVDDYAAGTSLEIATGALRPLLLGKADVLHFRFADGGFVMVRPSGTEPKLKIYFSVVGSSSAHAEALLADVQTSALQRMGLI